MLDQCRPHLVAIGSAALVAASIIVTGDEVRAASDEVCSTTVRAKVVALDQAFYINRLGALQIGGMIFALEHDVRSIDGSSELRPGEVMLRPDKRPRPIVLRMNVGDCLRIDFRNLLAKLPLHLADSDGNLFPQPVPPNSGYRPNEGFLEAADQCGDRAMQPPTRYAGVHVMGMEPVEAYTTDSDGNLLDLLPAIAANGKWTGANDPFGVSGGLTCSVPNAEQPLRSGLAPPGSSITYTLKATAEGSFLLHSAAATVGIGFGGQLSQGLFGAVTVHPAGAEWYRSQVTAADLEAATYRSGDLPETITLDPAFDPDGERKVVDGRPLWRMTTEVVPPDQGGPITRAADVVVVDHNDSPVEPNANGFIKTPDLHPVVNYDAVYAPGTSTRASPTGRTLAVNPSSGCTPRSKTAMGRSSESWSIAT